MKCLIGVLAVLLSAAAIAEDINSAGTISVTGSKIDLGHSFSIQAVPSNQRSVAIYGRSDNNVGVFGVSSAASGVFGATNTGVGGNFATYGSGTALSASVPFWLPIGEATALQVDGPMLKSRTPRNLIKVYDPETGALIGSFEFEIVQE